MIQKQLHHIATLLTTACLAISPLADAFAAKTPNPADAYPTTTPIKHIVVIFDENVSFDHYFATYPHATNPAGEPQFFASPNTPRVNNLLSSGLLDENPNSTQPFRLDRSQAVTCDENHGYSAEQLAMDKGLMDKFPESTGAGGPGCFDAGVGPGIVMGYFDGNTVTGLWNYAQHYAMSDNHFSTMFGPSTVGALNLIGGYTTGATVNSGSAAGDTANGATTNATIIGD